jgi:hypothetical protein
MDLELDLDLDFDLELDNGLTTSALPKGSSFDLITFLSFNSFVSLSK